MEYELIISNGFVLSLEQSAKLDIAIQDGKIQCLGQNLQGRDRIDAEGLYVLPGAVDPHVHLNMPTTETTSSDNWQSGTRAAAVGGTTSVIDFVEPERGQTLIEAWETRRQEAESGAVIDFGLHMTLGSADSTVVEEIPTVIQEGTSSFKLYTTYEGFALTDQEMLHVMAAVARAGGLVLVHSESDAIVNYATSQVIRAGNLSPAAHPLSRPPEAEHEAIQRVVQLAAVSGVTLYIVHVSTAGGAAAIASAVERGQSVYGETCPQYLLLTKELYELDGFEGAKYVCSPPLRSQKHQNALWDSLSSGKLHSIGTDHCPFFFDGQKTIGRDDFRRIPGGLPGIQSRLELMYSYGVVPNKITLGQWVDYCCAGPARIFGLYPQKGTIAPGADADLVLFDPDLQKIILHTSLIENVDYTPYDGYELQGAVVMTIAGGDIIAADGKYQDQGHKGSYLKRELTKE